MRNWKIIVERKIKKGKPQRKMRGDEEERNVSGFEYEKTGR